MTAGRYAFSGQGVRVLARPRESHGPVRYPAATPAEIARYERLIAARTPVLRPLDEANTNAAPLPRLWHVGTTNPRMEARVAAEMTARGIDTFVPMIRFTRYRSRTHCVGEKPLMPRYVLFRREFDSQHLVGIDGLERIVRAADLTWAAVPDRIVHELRLRTISREFEASKYGTRFMKWLVAHGELPNRAILLPKDVNKTKQNRVGKVARKHGR